MISVIRRRLIIKCLTFLLPPLIICLIIAIIASAIITSVSSLVDTVLAVGETKDFKKDLVEFTDRTDLDELDELGLGENYIHPYKVKEAIIRENDSIPQNEIVKRKTWSRVLNHQTNGWIDEDSNNYTLTDHTFKIYDEAYPYRLYYEMLVILDMLNEESPYPNKKDMIEKSAHELKPEFEWSFRKQGGYIVDYEYEEVIHNSTYTKVELYENGVLVSTDEEQVDYRYSYPLPYLNSVNTMFKQYKFNYAREILEDTGWQSMGRPTVKTWVGQVHDGQEYVDVYYKQVITKERRHRSEKDIIQSIEEIDSQRAYNFMKENGLHNQEDLEFASDLISMLPNSGEFLLLFSEFINYTSDAFYDYDSPNYDIIISPSELLNYVPLFIQTDQRWKNIPYGRSGTIGSSGCGPSAMSMVITALGAYNSNIDLNGDGIIDPYEAATWSIKNGYRAEGAGTYWSYFKAIGSQVGLEVREVGKSQIEAQAVLDALTGGQLVIASMGPGVFTKGGHYIVLTGIDKEGKIMVRDSNSVSRSNTTYDFRNPILSQAKRFWIISK